MKLIEVVELTRKPFILNYRHVSIGMEWNKFHAHQGIELLYIHQGSGQVVLEKKVYSVSSGTLIIFQPFQLHRVRIDACSTEYERTVLNFDPFYLENNMHPFPELKAYFSHLWKDKQYQQINMKVNINSELEVLYSRFHTRLSQASPETHNEEFILFMVSLLQMLRTTTEFHKKDSTHTVHAAYHAEAVMEWVENHFKEELSLERLASDLHLSPYHISHIFKKHTGLTITDYVISRRLHEACLLLSTSSLPINLICNEIGLSNTSYFSQLFKKKIEMSPKEYRDAIKKSYYS